MKLAIVHALRGGHSYYSRSIYEARAQVAGGQFLDANKVGTVIPMGVGLGAQADWPWHYFWARSTRRGGAQA